MSLNPEVAAIILAQLGGKSFVRMTGARDIIVTHSGISFRVNGRTRNGATVNKVVVILDPSDTYTVEVWYVRAGRGTLVDHVSDVYNDMLQPVFTALTGLHTRF